jgi:hypothetical protein
MAHFYKLYENEEELIKIASMFIKEGLGKGQYCFWAIPSRLKNAYVLGCMAITIRMIEHYKNIGQVEIVDSAKWYMPEGYFDMNKTLEKWKMLYESVKLKGFNGLRVVGDASWTKEKDWGLLMEYESKVNEALKNYNDLTALCMFDVSGIKSIVHISQVVNNHEDCFISD